MKKGKIILFLASTLLIVGLGSAIYYYINKLLDDIYLKKIFAYTVTKTVSIGTSSKAGNESKYTFFLNERWYAGFTNLPLQRDGTRYFIKFYPPNPNRNEATKVIADSNDIKNLPPNGYKRLPHQ